MRGALKGSVGVALAGLLAGLLPSGGAGSASAAACTPAAVPGDEVALTKMIVAKRRAAKLSGLRKDQVLFRAGRKKSMEMAAGGAFAHSSSMPWADGRAGGQNIAMAVSARIAFRTMLQSAPHRRNILDPEWRVTGVGAARDCAGLTFYTVNFATPAP